MTAVAITYIVSIAIALLVGWAIPAWTMRRLLPVLEASGHLVTNYRGRRIPTGLGLVWLVWAAAAGAAAALVTVMWQVWWSEDAMRVLQSRSLMVPAMLPLLLVVGAFAFGFVDDMYGAGSAKGFRGHLRAMREGRITTGGLKLLGIGLLAVLAATEVLAFREPLATDSSAASVLLALAGWACAALVIALSANLVNLMDLRPGRAIKAYGALSVIAVTIFVVNALPGLPTSGFLSASAALGLVDAKMPALVLAILLLGPVAAVWRYDLGERAMLGDAGANAMGALVGFFLAVTSPLWLLAVIAFVLLALNLVSEKVSFSKVIDRIGFLRWIDGLGRLPVEPHGTVSAHDDDGERAGGSAAADDGARKDGGTSKR